MLFDDYDSSTCLDTNVPEKLQGLLHQLFSLLANIDLLLKLVSSNEKDDVTVGNETTSAAPDANGARKLLTGQILEHLQQLLTTFDEECLTKHVLKTTFDTLKILCHVPRNLCGTSQGLLSFETLHKVIGLLQTVGKRTISPVKFDHLSMSDLIDALKGILPHLHQPQAKGWSLERPRAVSATTRNQGARRDGGPVLTPSSI